MKYAIGDVARILGLTTAGLHFFERQGVIEPRKGDKTRRFYGAEDIIRLISYKKYRSMQIPLKMIAQQFSPDGESVEGITNRLHAQYEDICQMAQKYEALAQDIRWFEQSILRAESAVDRIDIAIMPECYVLATGKDGFISPDKQEQTNVAKWLDHMPATRLSLLSREEGQACFCYSAAAGRAKSLGLDQTENVLYLPSCVALHMSRKLPYPFFDRPQWAFEPLWEEMHKRGFHQAQPAMGINLCVECVEDRRDSLCEIWLPIQ